MPNSPNPNTRPVPRIDWQQLTADVLNHQDTPLIVTGWQAPPRSLSPAELKTWLAGQLLWVYARNSGESWKEWAPDDFVDALSAPNADPGLNVVDVYLQDPRFDAVFPVHPALDDANLFNRDPRTAHYRRSVVMTAPGAYTPMHVDAYGCGGWMYLIEGEKHWELVDAAEGPRLWDKAAQDYADPRSGNWPDGVASWTATLRGGEMMIFPPGWVHRVATPARCVGFGGAFLPPGHAKTGVEVWQRELANAQAGDLDFADFLRNAAAASKPEEQKAIAPAFQALNGSGGRASPGAGAPA